MAPEQGPCIRVSLWRSSAIKLTGGKELRLLKRSGTQKLLKGSKNRVAGKHDPRAAERKLDPKTAERKRDWAAQPESLMQDGGEQQGTMGTSKTKVQEVAYKIMETILQKHHAKV